MSRDGLSPAEARRTALAAQGFDRTRPVSGGDIRHLRRVIRTLGLLQLDFVNVLVPAHYLVLFSRLGAYQTERLNELVYRRREFTEQWAHEASILPMDNWPLLDYRRRAYRPYAHSPIMKLKGHSDYLREVLQIVRDRGPVTANDLPTLDAPKRRAGDWQRSLGRWALEYHFGQGSVAVADRLKNFQRVYDLAERVIGAEHRVRQPTRSEAQRDLLRRAAMACGIGTAADLADYYRMSPKEALPRVRELVEEGTLIEVEVDGWSESAYLHHSARVPRAIEACSVLSPFDPLVWFRPRAERLFGFHYRIEIYVPARRRKWGYYVLPFLLDDRIVARADLKADRNKQQLLVLSAYPEDGVDRPRVARRLAGELKLLASWLGLENVRVARRGSLARPLAEALRDSALSR